MYVSIDKRKKIFKKISKNSFDDFEKVETIGQGEQGKVYKYCNDTNCIAVKKFYIKEAASKYLDNPFNKNALKYNYYIELVSNRLINRLVLENICPHFLLNYGHDYSERYGICDDKYPYNFYHYNEFLENNELWCDFIKKNIVIKDYYILYFQIFYSLYVLEKYFNLYHLDLFPTNILIKKIKKGGYWKYIIDDKIYYLENRGFIIYIIDFGHAWRPTFTKKRDLREQQKRVEKISREKDLQFLFKNTCKFEKSSDFFKQKIKNIISDLKKFEYNTVIHNMFGEIFNLKHNSKLLDTFNSNTELKN